MQIIKELFEKINSEAFNLKSIKEIYTKNLTEDERKHDEVDYISGFQILDNSMRITIFEGINGKGLQLVKDRLPKLDVNS